MTKLVDDETIILSAEMSLWRLFPAFLAASLIWVLAFVVGKYDFLDLSFISPSATNFGVFALAVFGGGRLLLAILEYHMYELHLTDRRVFSEFGLFQREGIEVRLSKIESVGSFVSLSGRILGYGTVVVTGSGGTPVVFPWIREHEAFREGIRRMIDSRENGRAS